MVINIEISIYSYTLHPRQRLILLQYKRKKAHQTFSELIKHVPRPIRVIKTIKRKRLEVMIARYSEQVTYKPIESIESWFAHPEGAYYGRGYDILFFDPKDSTKTGTPNSSTTGAIGEGLAGYLGQTIYQSQKWARPRYESPDIVMKGQGATFLVESKTTLDKLKRNMRDLYDLGNIWSACNEMDYDPVVGLLIQTQIASPSEMNCHIFELCPEGFTIRRW